MLLNVTWNYSESVAQKIDEAVSEFINKAYKVTEQILEDKADILEKIAKELLEKETIEKDRFEEIVGIRKQKNIDGTTKTEKIKKGKKRYFIAQSPDKILGILRIQKRRHAKLARKFIQW